MTARPPTRTALLLLALISPALASQPGSFDRTLPVSGPVYLDVKSDRGGIIITPGASSSVRVRAIIKPAFGRLDFDIAEANIRALEKNPPIEQQGNRIRVGYVKDPSLLRAVSMRLEIETPRDTEVHASTDSGGIRIAGIAGPVTASTGSGRTEILDVASEIRIDGRSGSVAIRNAGAGVFVRTQSGALKLSAIRGAVETETTSGRTQVSDVSGGLRSVTQSASIEALRLGASVHAETGSGTIRISQLTPAPVHAVSGSGAIKVKLASGGGYLVDARSESGKVSGPVPNAPAAGKPDPHHLDARLGPGGPLVHLRTRSSSINID